MKTRMKLLLVAMAASVVLIAGCALQSAVPGYDQAQRHQKRGKLAEAIKAYDTYITAEEGQDSALTPFAMYHIAECYEGLYKKPEAMAAYEKIIRQHSQSDPAKWAKEDIERLKTIDLTPPMKKPGTSTRKD